MESDNNYVVIDLDVIRDNFRAIREKAGVPVMAIIKADAYGHGAVQIAKTLETESAFFGVSSIQEALELRNAGIKLPILVLGQMSVAAYPLAVREGIRPAIFREEDALELSREAVKQGVTAPFHFAVDTGMSRLGLEPEEASADICARIAQLPGLDVEGLFSHFATADCEDLERTRMQIRRFEDFDEMLRQRGVKIRLRHLENSAGIMNFSTAYEMARAGIITYGLYPSQEVDARLIRIKPALSWTSRITQLKWLAPGREISYGGTYTTQHPTLVATVSIGYADGYRRNLSGRFYVLIRGQKAPILGRICMDQMMVDVTEIPGVSLEDPVTLIGHSGEAEISVEEIAAQADSFNYEFVCGISRRVPRYYRKNGEIVGQVHYLLD